LVSIPSAYTTVAGYIVLKSHLRVGVSAGMRARMLGYTTSQRIPIILRQLVLSNLKYFTKSLKFSRKIVLFFVSLLPYIKY